MGTVPVKVCAIRLRQKKKKRVFFFKHPFYQYCADKRRLNTPLAIIPSKTLQCYRSIQSIKGYPFILNQFLQLFRCSLKFHSRYKLPVTFMYAPGHQMFAFAMKFP